MRAATGRWRWFAGAGFLLCALAFAVLAQNGCVSLLEPAAYRRGVKAAETDIAKGNPRLVFLGLPRHDAGWLDEETGLPRSTLGCVWSEEKGAFMAGYNDTVGAALRAGKLDGAVLKHKVTTREAAMALLDGDAARPLAIGDSPLDAPGGRFRIEAAPRNNHGDMRPYVFVTERLGGGRHELHWLNPGARVAFDHDGTTLVLRDAEFQQTLTFDLPSRLHLQSFRDPEGAR
jgi:hypothetical protein